MIPARLHGDQTGITLVEISVVLAVLGVLLALSFPSLKEWRRAVDLRSTAAKVAEIMLSARMRSVVERRDYLVSVDYTADVCSVSPPVGTAQVGGAVDFYLDNTDPDCPSLSSRNVVFRPNGTADAAGFEAVYLKSRSARVPARYRVKVLGATGKVSVERWAGGAWIGA
jgi:prepilin-type N-terminal cleavage/methylation domain-containing protein